ncbi:hypothetical protein [Acetobacter cibinongensis]|uniref:Uncharacterized protein n=1 Tax=Acetobacter cibinongensis TaxID=146475 RepID=A0A1Z5YTL5_9PROT|nr:hypothetical protein [Acetobacter cibinongensis]OUJ01682.1 hypothetical protein HK14_08745 [Acetobacter cibinongensis]
MMSVSFPEWMPLWAQLLFLAVAVVFGLGFLMMPFAVFGVKGRLAQLELQVQELHADVRAISMRLASAQGVVETGNLSRDMFDRPADPPQLRAVVEEIRPPEPPKPAVVPSAPTVLTPVRAPRVSDAYEPRQDAPPVPHSAPERSNGPTGRRMPWHEEAKGRDEFGRQERRADEVWRDRAPDANQLPYRPDFSRERESLRKPYAAQQEMGRTEPVLNWPPRTPSA